LLASALTLSRQFEWRDIVISTLATGPVVVGMLVGQKVRDAIPRIVPVPVEIGAAGAIG
jgi:hypothetical protein